MRPNQIFKFLHSKWNHKQNEKSTYRMGENIASDVADKALISKIYEQLNKTTTKKQQQPNRKMVRRPKRTFLQRTHTDGQKAHDKMLNITNY